MASFSFSTICNMLFKPNRSKILYTFGFKPYITKSPLLALKSSIWAIKTPNPAKEIIADYNPFLTKIYAPLAEKVSAKREIKEIELFAPNASISEDDKLVIVEKKYW